MTGLLHMTLAASVLIGAAALVRSLFLDRLPKGLFTALWLMAALRLLVPWSVPVPVLPASEAPREISPVFDAVPVTPGPVGPAVYVAEPIPTPARTAPVQAETAAATATATSSDTRAPFDWSMLARILWAAGAAAVLGYFLTGHLLCLRRYREAVPADSPAVAAALEYLGSRRVRVKVAQGVATPLTYGLIRPVILLPKDAAAGNSRQLTYVLCHELTHIRRLHILYKYVLIAAVCLHWFNPMVWLMFTLAGRDLELSCDEGVLRTLRGDRTGYAMALISQEASRGLSPLESGFGARAVKERIVSIMKYRRRSAACLALAAALVISSATVFATAVEAAPGPSISAPFVTTPPSPTPAPFLYPDPTPSVFDAAALAPVEAGGRTEVVIGTDAPAEMSGLGLLVNAFNETNEDYYASVVTYGSRYGWTPMDELPRQLSAGEGPDVLFISGAAYDMAAYGMDLTGLLGQDGLSGLLPALGAALARREAVRCLPVTVALNAFAAPAGTDRTGLTYDEALALAEGQDAYVFEPWRTGRDILSFLSSAAGDFIDYGAGTCDFENDSFTAMLAEAAGHPAEYADAVDFDSAALLRWCTVNNVLLASQDVNPAAGEQPVDCVLTGLPTGGSGVWMDVLDAISVPEGAADIDGALAFLRFALSDAGQLCMQSTLDRGTPTGLPVTVSALEALCRDTAAQGQLDQTDAEAFLAMAEGPAGYGGGTAVPFPATAVSYWGGLTLDGTISAGDAAAYIQQDVSAWLQTGVMTAYPDDRYQSSPPDEPASDPAPVRQYQASPTPTPTPPSTVPDMPVSPAMTPEPTPSRVDPPDALVGDPPSEDNTVYPTGPVPETTPPPGEIHIPDRFPPTPTPPWTPATPVIPEQSPAEATPPAAGDGPRIPDRFPPTPTPEPQPTPEPVPAGP